MSNTETNPVAEMLEARGFKIEDLTGERSSDALAAIVEASRERAATNGHSNGKPVSIPVDFFNRPIPIRFAIPDYIQHEDGSIEIVQRVAQVDLKRSKNGQINMLTYAALVSIGKAPTPDDDETKLMHLCNLIEGEPQGFDGFPIDARPVKERAFEYLKERLPGSMQIVDSILEWYGSETNPTRIFR